MAGSSGKGSMLKVEATRYQFTTIVAPLSM
jgi:hypothetical protein